MYICIYIYIYTYIYLYTSIYLSFHLSVYIYLSIYTALSLTILDRLYCNTGGSRGNNMLRNSECDEEGKWGAQTKVVFA